MERKKPAKRVPRERSQGDVLRGLATLCDESPHLAAAVAPLLKTMLDELDEDDWFGTEGQSDPRGDRRNRG